MREYTVVASIATVIDGGLRRNTLKQELSASLRLVAAIPLSFELMRCEGGRVFVVGFFSLNLAPQ